MKRNLFLTAILFLVLSNLAEAIVEPSHVFGSHMVLQRNLPISIWGKAAVGEKITLILDKQTIKTKADKKGDWKVSFSPMIAGGPYTLSIAGKNQIVFEDIMIGDVWICSGQSNMEWPVMLSKNSDKEISNSNNSMIRMFTVNKLISTIPDKYNDNAEWVLCNDVNVAGFSAVGYFFGRELQNKYNIAIGLVNISWGGTDIEAWTSHEALQSHPDFTNRIKDENPTSIMAAKKEMQNTFETWSLSVKAQDPGYANGKPIWADIYADVTGWNKIQIPGLWDDQGFKDLDGIVWLRCEFDLKADELKNGTLNLGMIDDSDETFLNGSKIGSNFNQYSKNRSYKVDKMFLKEGKNVLVVRVEDYGGGGGIYGNPNYVFFENEKIKVNLFGEWKMKIALDKIPPTPKTNFEFSPNKVLSSLFNGMLFPFVNYGIKGAIWYQGENNANRAYQYRELFPLMIRDWRKNWGIGDFPFIFVQLANYTAKDEEPKDNTWSELREAQFMTLSESNTAMASAIDLGEEKDIHPKNKQDVGFRLALGAMKIAYNEEVVHSGPVFQKFDVLADKAIITFNTFGSELSIKDKYACICGFSVAGADSVFHWAQGRLLDKNKVEVFSTKVKNPVAVRYGWSMNPDLTIFNKEGLPAIPFRTDQWNGITFGKK